MAEGRQRLDKWLWFARFAKTRTLAAKLVSEGAVRVNGTRAEAPAKLVGPGDVLTVAAQHATVVVRVVSPGERRGPAPEARSLYEEVPRDAPLVTTPGSG
jgi:ribosome-associated heat shock protein Hsp15